MPLRSRSIIYTIQSYLFDKRTYSHVELKFYKKKKKREREKEERKEREIGQSVDRFDASVRPAGSRERRFLRFLRSKQPEPTVYTEAGDEFVSFDRERTTRRPKGPGQINDRDSFRPAVQSRETNVDVWSIVGRASMSVSPPMRGERKEGPETAGKKEERILSGKSGGRNFVARDMNGRGGRWKQQHALSLSLSPYIASNSYIYIHHIYIWIYIYFS